jgi:hypothetical protein
MNKLLSTYHDVLRSYYPQVKEPTERIGLHFSSAGTTDP